MGFAGQRVKYGAGWGSSRIVKDLSEGVPAVRGDLPVFSPVMEGQGGNETARAELGIPDVAWRAGAAYYEAQIRTVFSPSWACHWLDALFEDKTVGASPNYQRTYYLEHAPAIAAVFNSLWKWTARASNDVVQCIYGGIMRGFSFEIAHLGSIFFTPSLVFAFNDEAVSGVSDSAAWDIPTTGNCTPPKATEITRSLDDGGGLVQIHYVRSMRLTVSWEAIPTFWDAQAPSRITRRKLKITGEIEIRDVDDEVEVWNGYRKDGTTLYLTSLVTGSFLLQLNFKLTGGGDAFEAGTRLGRYSFEIVDPESGSYQYPLALSLTPERL